MGYFGKILGGAKSLVTGMGITFKELFATTVKGKAVTQQYPKDKPVLSPAYRSAIQFVRFEETNSHDCVACKACERICPSFCIKLDGGKVEGIKKKRVDNFEMDFALCSLCGLCIDVCPTDTLEYSKVYDEAGYNRDWRVDLVAEFRDYEAEFLRQQRAREDVEAAEKKAKSDAVKAAKLKAAEAKAAEAKAAEAKAAEAAPPDAKSASEVATAVEKSASEAPTGSEDKTP